MEPNKIFKNTLSKIKAAAPMPSLLQFNEIVLKYLLKKLDPEHLIAMARQEKRMSPE